MEDLREARSMVECWRVFGWRVAAEWAWLKVRGKTPGVARVSRRY